MLPHELSQAVKCSAMIGVILILGKAYSRRNLRLSKIFPSPAGECSIRAFKDLWSFSTDDISKENCSLSKGVLAKYEAQSLLVLW
jgi:hypothetical protein